jgi:23S rRNA (cytosine1962-C5)-methyltransferase
MLRRGFFQEDELIFRADFVEGQKTGFFLDQRDNRGHLEQIIKHKKDPRVLDLLCYSGGWGFHALRAGAAHVTFVDQSEEAIQFVREGLEKNHFDQKRAALKNSDVFEFLESTSEEFDVIVADPPAFVKSKKNLPQALKAYEKLNRLAWRKLRSGGVLMTSSCSYHLSESDFLNVLTAAVSKEGGRAHLIYRGGQAADHPVLLSMPETRYLKCIGLKKL